MANVHIARNIMNAEMDHEDGLVLGLLDLA
jgi:hypothetical protein